MELVVFLAIVVVFFEALADHKPIAVRVDGDIAGIEQLVDIGTQEDAVGDVVGVRVGPLDDMRGFKNWQRVLPADGTLTMIGIGHFDAERPLALTDLTQGILWRIVVIVEGQCMNLWR